MPQSSELRAKEELLDIIDDELLSRWRVPEKVARTLERIRARLLNHLLVAPTEHLEKGVDLLQEILTPLQLKKEIQKYFPDVKIDDIAC